MASDYQTQYRPVQTRETAGQDCLSTRVIMDLARGINNAAVVLSPKLWSQAWDTTPPTLTTGTDETIFTQCGPFYVPDCYDALTWSVNGFYGTATQTWRLYSMSRPFFYDQADKGSTFIDKLGEHTVASVTVNTTVPRTFTSMRQQGIARSPWGYTTLMLTMDGSGGGSSGHIHNIDVSAQIDEAY